MVPTISLYNISKKKKKEHHKLSKRQRQNRERNRENKGSGVAIAVTIFVTLVTNVQRCWLEFHEVLRLYWVSN